VIILENLGYKRFDKKYGMVIDRKKEIKE